MADLDTTPISNPVASENIVIKPEFQTDITSNFGNKNVEFFFPDFIEYFLPSQSYLQANVLMQGRGMPVPNPSAAFHSFINTLRIYNGERSQLLSELVQYNTSVAQKFTYSKTDAIQNIRLNDEGQQAIDSYDQNLYYELGSNNKTWASYKLSTPAAPITSGSTGSVSSIAQVAKECQIQTTLKAFMLNTDKFMPLNVLGGIRMDLQIEQMNRALTFTSGKLGIGFENGLMAHKSEYTRGGPGRWIFGAAGGAGPENGGYTDNMVYPLKNSAGNTCGYINVGTTTAGVIQEGNCVWVASAGNVNGNTMVPVGGEEYIVGGTAGGTGAGNQAIRLKSVNASTNTAITTLLGNGQVCGMDAKGSGSPDSSYFVEVATGALLQNNIADNIKNFGAGTLRDPERSVNAIPKTQAGLGQDNQFPNNNNPFAIGDKLYIAGSTVATEKVLGTITGFMCGRNNGAGTPTMRILYKADTPNTTCSANLPTDLGTGQLIGTFSIPPDVTDYPTTHFENVIPNTEVRFYVKESDRINGYTVANNTFPSWSADCATEIAKKVNFKISDLQYSVKKVDIDRKIAEADMAAANSSQGYRLDIEEDFTQLTNLVSTQGPTSQLISNPNITRALAVLSVPLDQNIQNSLAENSLIGTPSNMTSYQYNLGTDGRVPLRPVNVEKASLGNPLIQTQAISELMKTNEAMGYFTSNLNQVGMNFSVGRAFSLPGMYYDLMEAGSLMLLANFNTALSGMKLFIHYIHHLRTITISREGISVEN